MVRPQEHPDLDHRVRLRDEAGRAEGRHGVEAGGVRAAGGRDREGEPARADVHLVRLPGLAGKPLAERHLPHGRHAPSRRSRSGPPRPSRSTRATRRSPSRAASRIRRLRSTCASSAPPARPASSSERRPACALNGKLVGVSQPAGPLQVNCTVGMRLPVKVAKKKTYVATIDLNTAAGGIVVRKITIVGA